MKKLLKWLPLLAAVVLLTLLFALPASAETEGDYTYTVSDGEATITDFETSVSGAITIPSTLGGYPVTSIGERAFSGCSSLTSITIPGSVTSIGKWAFFDCSSLTSITIPNSVTSIGSSAFYDCSSLTSINIPEGVTSIGSSAFEGCSSLTGITIPGSVTSIGKWAFFDCSSLTSITIPNSVTSIGSSAFGGCSSLTSIDIPDSVTSIGGGTFSDCSGLTSIDIPDSVTSISYATFWGCSSLTSITIPDSVTSIASSAFGGCSNLTIYCYENSTAHTYAVNRSIPYILLGAAHTCADADNNHKCDTCQTVLSQCKDADKNGKCDVCDKAFYHVLYDANGGTGEVPADEATYPSGSTVSVLFDKKPTRSGYQFVGWATASGATAAQYTESGTKSFTLGSADVTLYAVWKKVDVADGFVKNDGDTYYYVNNTVVTDYYIINNQIYYFGSDGKMTTDGVNKFHQDGYISGNNVFVTVNNNKYYIVNNTIVTDYYIINNQIYYFGTDGKLTTDGVNTFAPEGFIMGDKIYVTINNNQYYLVNNSITAADCNVTGKHAYGNWEVTKAATCTEKGTERHVCLGCGKEETREIAALGHDFAGGDDTTDTPDTSDAEEVPDEGEENTASPIESPVNTHTGTFIIAVVIVMVLYGIIALVGFVIKKR